MGHGRQRKFELLAASAVAVMFTAQSSPPARCPVSRMADDGTTMNDDIVVTATKGAVILQVDNGLELSAWAHKLTNDQYLGRIFPSVAQSGSLSGYPSQPRTYGMSGRIKF